MYLAQRMMQLFLHLLFRFVDGNGILGSSPSMQGRTNLNFNYSQLTTLNSRKSS